MCCFSVPAISSRCRRDGPKKATVTQILGQSVRPDVRHMHSIRALHQKKMKQSERECVDTDTTRSTIGKRRRGIRRRQKRAHFFTRRSHEGTNAHVSHCNRLAEPAACLSLYMLAHNSANVRMCWFWCAMCHHYHHCSRRASCAPSRALNKIVSD